MMMTRVRCCGGTGCNKSLRSAKPGRRWQMGKEVLASSWGWWGWGYLMSWSWSSLPSWWSYRKSVPAAAQASFQCCTKYVQTLIFIIIITQPKTEKSNKSKQLQHLFSVKVFCLELCHQLDPQHLWWASEESCISELSKWIKAPGKRLLRKPVTILHFATTSLVFNFAGLRFPR